MIATPSVACPKNDFTTYEVSYTTYKSVIITQKHIVTTQQHSFAVTEIMLFIGKPKGRSKMISNILRNYYTTYTEFLHNILLYYAAYEIILYSIWLHFNTNLIDVAFITP